MRKCVPAKVDLRGARNNIHLLEIRLSELDVCRCVQIWTKTNVNVTVVDAVTLNNVTQSREKDLNNILNKVVFIGKYGSYSYSSSV